MSVLDAPRIYFRGQMTWDPIVTNNYAQFYHLASGKPTLGSESVDAYRERARQAIPQGNWNAHGTHRSVSFDTFVTGVDRGQGRTTEDSLVGVPVTFAGKLVDLDPYGATTSQLYFDEFSCGIQGGAQILGLQSGPMVARRINFARNSGYTYIAGPASVVWQTSFPVGDPLTVAAHGSGVLDQLQEILGEDGVEGITVRFNTYRTVYYNTESPTPQQAQELAHQIAQGGFHPNPARSLLVGVIGLWRSGEAPSAPCDRVLAKAGSSPVWTAFAKLGEDRVTIDMSNSIPETAADVPKQDLGTLTLVAKAPGGDVKLGSLQYSDYDQQAYERTSGIVTLRLDEVQAVAAASADLELREENGTALLTEQALSVVADPPNVYLEEGEQAAIALHAYLRGVSPGSPVAVSLLETGGPLPPVKVQTASDGLGSMPLNSGKPGSWTWILVPHWLDETPALPTTLNPALNEYVVLRTTPADDDIAALAPTWENVHRYVLRDWEALAPCMDNWLRLGDEQQCRAYAALVKRLTSRANFNSYTYMPVTRELSPGQRTLLHAWCDVVTGVVSPAELTARAAAEAPVPRDPFGRGF